MQKTCEKYHSLRPVDEANEEYQSLDLERDNTGFLRIELMTSRWRSPEELAGYLRWAAEQVEDLGTSKAATPRQLDRLVDKFLAWKLPEDFCPDGGISFKREYNEHTAHPMKHEPVGTNLFTATQARQMLEYLLVDVSG